VEVALLADGNVIEQQAATWNPTDSWKHIGRLETAKHFVFPLAAVMNRLGDRAFSSLKFQIKYQLNTKSGAVLEAEEERPAVNAASLIAPALSSFVEVEVNSASINWRNIDANPDARSIGVVLNVDGKEFRSSLEPKNVGGVWQAPTSARFIVPTKAKSVKLSMTMIASNGRLLKWKHSDVDLERLDTGNSIEGVTRRMVAPLPDQFAQ
jgi:hypothetical protein